MLALRCLGATAAAPVNRVTTVTSYVNLTEKGGTVSPVTGTRETPRPTLSADSSRWGRADPDM